MADRDFNIMTIWKLLVAGCMIRHSFCFPIEEDTKALYKSGEIVDQETPMTLNQIKNKMKESGIFDWKDPSLSKQDKKDLAKLFDVVEIMTTSRNRQPTSVHNIFSSLRVVERAVKNQMKEGQISEELAAKFNWNKIRDGYKRL